MTRATPRRSRFKKRKPRVMSDPTTIPPLGCLLSFFLFAIPRQRVWGLHDPYVKGRGGPSAELGGAAPPHWQNSSGKKFSCRPPILLGVVFSFFEQFTNKILSAGVRTCTWRISKSESLISHLSSSSLADYFVRKRWRQPAHRASRHKRDTPERSLATQRQAN